MDALYLKENINDAISEGLTAMVVQSPDDPIEYLGNYLLNYVDRQIGKKKVCNWPQERYAPLVSFFLFFCICLLVSLSLRGSFHFHFVSSFHNTLSHTEHCCYSNLYDIILFDSIVFYSNCFSYPHI